MRVRHVAALAMLALAACRQQPEQPASPPSPRPAATPTPGPSAAAARVDLSRYAGKYPTEKVAGGTSFLDDPAVRAAVAAVVPDAALRARVLDVDVTATPIATVDGRLLAFACEPHNCGPHNWAVAVAPDGARAAVCYYDEDRRIARWYPQDAAAAPANGCPSGD